MEKDNRRLEDILAFVTEIDKTKEIVRQTWLADGSRKENDAEHAWHMAMMAILLKEYANEEVDLLEVISMILMHDLVEIYAGDTYAYDEEGKKDQAKREHAAADTLFAMLPADLEERMHGLFEQFESGDTKEAHFARALDRMQPMLLNRAAGGKGWQEHTVKFSAAMDRNAPIEKGSTQLWAYCYDNILLPGLEMGIIDDRNE